MDLHATNASTTELERIGDAIAELSAHLDAASARLLDLIRDFDARGGWNNGFRSCAEWLSWRVGLDLGAAREKVRVARALATLPRLARALVRGELSYAKVRALTRVATPDTEERLLAIGRAGTAEHVERIVRGWRRMDRKAEKDEARRQHASRALHVYPNDDGTTTIRGRLSPEAGAILLKALTAARQALYSQQQASAPDAKPRDAFAETPTMAQQQADALQLIAETALQHGIDPGSPAEHYQVVVHVDASVLNDPEQPRSVCRRRRCARSRGNVPATGLRRESSRDGARCRGAYLRRWRQDPHDPAGVAARTPLSRPQLSLPGLPRALLPGASHPPLGPRRPDDTVESGAALPASSSRGPRGRLSCRAHVRWRDQISRPVWSGCARCAVSASGAIRPSERGEDSQRCGRRRGGPTDRHSNLAG